MKLDCASLRASIALLLPFSLLSFAQAPSAHAATVTATGTDAAICNQEVSTSTGVTVQRLVGGDCLIAFTQPSTLAAWTAPSDLYSVRYLVIGGGGGGATGYDSAGGGGGGAGMMLTGSLSIAPGTDYEINVGAGGNGGANARANNWGSAGTETTFSLITASGGQGGYGSRSAPGGARVGGAAQVGTTTSGRGGNGGTGGSGGGGGGGASGAGGNGAVSAGGGSAGAGLASDITGTSVTYAAGGSGGSSVSAVTGASGSNNTGRGGNAGGGANASSGGGGAGGSGVVYIRYSTTPAVFNSLKVQGGLSAARYRTSTTLEASVQSEGRVTFLADGKRIPRCIDIAATGSANNYVATCNWLPSRKGAVSIGAITKPTAPGLTSRTSTNVSVITRTTRR